MKFKDFAYTRPNLEEVEAAYKQHIADLNDATTAEEQVAVIDKYNEVRRNYSTMRTLSSIRSSVNTEDEFYKGEEEFFNEVGPMLSNYQHQFSVSLANSKFRNELEAKYGTHLFNILELRLKTFDPVIIPDMQQENKLTTEYRNLLASAKIEFDGKINNLSQMAPYAQSVDRTVRKNAEAAIMEFFSEHEEKLDEIYDSLVKLRHGMAEKLGFENYIKLAYARLGRSDYDEHDVATYREQVYEDVVPVVKEIIKQKQTRLGIKDMMSYDLSLEYLSGNATPKGTKDELVSVAREMYEEMSPETNEFINFMIDKDLMDLEAKPGKAGGGYCTFINNYRAPFIFANFNGTAGDVDVLTHEAGHAFQMYSCRDFTVPEYIMPTLEACEIHSMSMEFFAWPWVEGFFKEDTDKYKYSHLTGAISFIPYGVAVDEFQHEVFLNPSMTPAERKAKWREIEKKYLPYKHYENDLLERGGFWLRQSHIFSVPFYYIDYTLAQVCAFQYWHRNNVDAEEAWKSFVKLCQAGGSKSFLDLLKVANLKNPFIKGTIKQVMQPLNDWISSFNQDKLK